MSNGNTESLLTEWFRRVWNEGEVSAIHALAAADIASHGLLQTIHGPDAWKTTFHDPIRQAFTDVQIEVLEEVVAGDRIFARLVATMTPRTTGKAVPMPGMCLMRIADGKIAEAWDTWEFLSLLEGMRLLPAGSFGQAITGKLAQHPLA
jgi:ketosteroid isomerase-like protein